MSRGLGRLQREILAAIDGKEWCEAGHSWKGGEATRRQVWSVSRGIEFNPAADVIDIRGVSRLLAERRGAIGYGGGIEPVFSAAFSRALRGLADRKHLQPCDNRMRFFRRDAA